MPRRVSKLLLRLAIVVVAAVPVTVTGEQIELAGDFDHASGIAVRQPPEGGLEVAIAESGAGRVLLLKLLGDRVLDQQAIVESLPIIPTAVAWAADGTLFVASDVLRGYRCEDDRVWERAAQASAKAPLAACSSVGVSDTWAFCTCERQLLVSRRVAMRLTNLRPARQELANIRGATLSPRGYLTVLHVEKEGFSLSFSDPMTREGAPATLPVAGLVNPTMLIYGSSSGHAGRSLYAMERGQPSDPALSGVVQIDADQKGGTAKLVAPIQSPSAFAVGPSGAIFAVTQEEGKPGKLYKVRSAL